MEAIRFQFRWAKLHVENIADIYAGPSYVRRPKILRRIDCRPILWRSLSAEPHVTDGGNARPDPSVRNRQRKNRIDHRLPVISIVLNHAASLAFNSSRMALSISPKSS